MATDTDLYAMTEALLAAQGVDVAHALQRAEDARAAEAARTRETARRARDVAISLRVAERRLLSVARAFNDSAIGFTSADLHEAEERVNRLRAQLTAACCDDPELARDVRRQVA